MRLRPSSFARAVALLIPCLLLPLVARAPADEKKEEIKGARVFSCGHSFHYFMPGNLAEVAKHAGVKDHKQVGVSAIGGSRVIQHWNVAGASAAWGKNEYVVDVTVDAKTKTATARILAKGKAAPIKADKILLSLEKPKVQLELRAKKQAKDPDDTASVFVGTNDELGEEPTFAGKTSAEFGDKKYSGELRRKNQAKDLLGKGEVDVLTLSPIYLPDDGIDKFVALALKHNKDVRVLVQANWLPWDVYDPKFKSPGKVDHDAPTAEDLKKQHKPYFESLDEYVRGLNKTHKTEAVRVAPVGQAVLLLREKILDGKAPGLKKQSDLFTDDVGHAKAPIVALSAYCYYALIYGRSPVGLPMPSVLANTKADAKLNTLLQELAWEAVTKHPLSGVKATK